MALDTIEVLFSGFKNDAIVRSEIQRLFRFLKSKGVTAIITGEKGEKTLTRYGLEEYVADCVILLDNRMEDQIATRRLRIIKYRGSRHGTNEYPFLIEENGITVMPITSLKLEHAVSNDRISSGIERLDNMLDGSGFFKGSSILVSGTAGTGKTSFAASFVASACQRGERCLYFAFEESPSQITRNMSSIGINFEPWIKSGLLQIHAMRPMAYGLEMHLASIISTIDKFQPSIVIFDPISNLTNVGIESDAKFMLTRVMDYLKTKGATTLSTSLTNQEDETNSAQGISSLMDTWLKLSIFENNGERNRGISVIKSRGMAHSNQVRELQLTDHGIELMDVYLGQEGGLMMGTARSAQEAKDQAVLKMQKQEMGRKKRELEHKIKSLDAQMALLKSEFESEKEELNRIVANGESRDKAQTQSRDDMSQLRKADS